MRSTLIAAWTGLVIAAAGCQSPADPLARAVERTRRADVNLVFILIDTLRADHLGSYGYTRATSPALDALASIGIRFAHARSQSSWTKASMASLWTASYPARTGVLRYQHALPASVTMPAEALRKAGFFTGGIWRNGWIAPNFGFAQGFDLYVRPVPARPSPYSPPASGQPMIGTDQDLTVSAIEFLRTYGSRRFFLYLHYMDVHQYLYDDSSNQFGVAYEDSYDNAILWVDKNITQLLATLEQMNVLDRTLIVVASDHGEAFNEHGGEGHGRNLYKEVTHVPLIFALPENLTPPIVVDERVENIDIWPTIFDLLGLPAVQGWQGRSLVPAMRRAKAGSSRPSADATPRPGFAQIDQTWGQEKAPSRPQVSMTRGRYRLIQSDAPRRSELYDLERDGREQSDISANHPEIVEAMKAEVTRHRRDKAAPWGEVNEVELDEMRLEQLRALGYMAGGR